MSADSHTNHYTVLGVGRNATLQDIRSAYKKLALKLHPDKAGDGKESTAKFRQVAEAVEILSNSGLRRKHDELLDRSALTGLGLENFWDNFGIRPDYGSPAATDNNYWTGPWEANNWGSRSCEAPEATSWETPNDKPFRRPPHTRPRPVQSREPSPLRKHDIWEEYLYGARLNGMEYGPDATDAFPAYNELQHEPSLKQKIGGIYSTERDKGAAKAAVSSQRRAPRQSASSSRSHEGISDVYIDVLERRIKTRMEALKALMQAHEEELRQEIFFENHLPARYEGFGNIPAVPDNDKRSVNPTHTACFPGSGHEHHGHAPDDGSSIDSSAPKTGDGLPKEDLTPRPSIPSQGDGFADERTNSPNNKGNYPSDETVIFSCVNSPNSLSSGEFVDSAKLTDDDSDGGIVLPAEDPVKNNVGHAEGESDDMSGDYKSFVPFIPFYRIKLRESNGRYTSRDLYSELEGLVKQAFHDARQYKEEPLSNLNPHISLTRNSAKVCSHANLWVRQLNRPKCKVCSIFKPLYVLECSGCDAMACVRCRFQKSA